MVSEPGISDYARGRMRRMRQMVCWDKDSTLSDSTPRLELAIAARAGKATWAEYAAACTDDTPFEGAVALMNLLHPLYLNVVLSGAHECPEALDWMEKYLRTSPGFASGENPFGYPLYDDYRLRRPEHGETENALLKVRWIREYQAIGYDVILVVEDWPPAAETIRELTGVPVLVLNPCYEAEIKAAQEYRGGTI